MELDSQSAWEASLEVQDSRPFRRHRDTGHGFATQRAYPGWAGAAAIAAAVAAGILTLFTSSNWWSYIMAVGFITALLAYGSLLLPATAPAHDSAPSSAPQA